MKKPEYSTLDENNQEVRKHISIYPENTICNTNQPSLWEESASEILNSIRYKLTEIGKYINKLEKKIEKLENK